jgi:Ku protein
VRPSWNGHLRLSLVSCPIGLVPATTEVERIKLNQLNPKTGNRISLKPVDSETGEPLERSEIVKGYKLEGDQYVILENEELKHYGSNPLASLTLKPLSIVPTSTRFMWMPRCPCRKLHN